MTPSNKLAKNFFHGRDRVFFSGNLRSLYSYISNSVCVKLLLKLLKMTIVLAAHAKRYVDIYIIESELFTVKMKAYFQYLMSYHRQNNLF